MSRRKVVKEELEERIEEAEVIMRWSAKRIVVATAVVIVIIVAGLYVISLLSQRGSSILGEKSVNKPQIKLPNEKNVEKILDQAQQDLANINAKDIISSQPKLQQIINDLTSITSSSRSAKDLICQAVCK